MAQTLQNIRAKMLTSIHGRRLGIDRTEFLTGVKAIRCVVTDITTSGSVLPNHGFVTLGASTNATPATLESPETGVGVDIAIIAASTGTWVVTSASTAATFTSSEGTADTKITFNGTVGANVSLMGISTAVWVLLAGQSTGLDAEAS